MARLTCVYCNNVIKRSYTKCPNCGAETESSIKKFTEERKAETEQLKSLLDQLVNRRRKCVVSLVFASFVFVMLSALSFMMIRASTAKTIVFVVLVLSYAVCLIAAIKVLKKNRTEYRELNNRIDVLSFNIIFECEDAQPYKMINDSAMINEGCYIEGLQQIAFKVRITNGSSQKIEFTLNDEFFGKDDTFGYHVRLNAAGVRMEDSKLVPFFPHHEENHKTFEPPLYTEGFKKVVLHPHESLVGWVGFYVNPESDDFELLFADDSVMIKNPLLADN